MIQSVAGKEYRGALLQVAAGCLLALGCGPAHRIHEPLKKTLGPASATDARSIPAATSSTPHIQTVAFQQPLVDRPQESEPPLTSDRASQSEQSVDSPSAEGLTSEESSRQRILDSEPRQPLVTNLDSNFTGGMTLQSIEALALANNPSLSGLAATTRKAAGFRNQVGLPSNPTVGYQAVQLADQGTDQHTAFFEQEIVTAGKLELNRRVLNEAVRAQLLELETRRARVVTDVRVKFFDALTAQRRFELITDFQTVTDKGLELAELRKAALEGSQVDVLQAKVQKNEIDLARQQAQASFQAAWGELVALAGLPQLPLTPLQGELPTQADALDWTSLSASIMAASPERQTALARVSQARANLVRQDVQAVPNLLVQLGAGFDNGTDSGLINLQVGAPIPVFNQNQGNIAAARAEYCRAVQEVNRIEDAIQARLAAAAGDYNLALAALTTFGDEILPSAAETLELAELAYRAGETSFIQVLVARRTYFDSNLQYLQAQGQLAQAQSLVDGYLLTGALEPIDDQSGDDSLRGLTFSR